MSPEDVVLSEISQAQKDKGCMVPLIGGTRNSRSHKGRKWNGVTRARAGVGQGGVHRTGSLCFMGTKLQFARWKEFCKLMVAMVTQQCKCISCHQTVYSEMMRLGHFMFSAFDCN